MQQPPNPYPQFQPQQWQQSPMPPQQQWNPQQPPFPPQEYQQPPQYQPPMPPQYKPPTKPPARRSRTWLWLLVAAIFIIAVIMGLVSRGQNQQPTPTTQATQQPTTQPTAKPTTAPTKPTPVSIQSQVQQLAQNSGTYTHADTVTYDTQFKEAYVTESFPLTSDNSLDVPRIKGDAFAIQKAVWQAHVKDVDAVMVMFNSDADGTRLATCLLDSGTAATLQWASVSNDQLWTACQGWLSPSLGG